MNARVLNYFFNINLQATISVRKNNNIMKY